jgi:hypothetical protein
MKMRVVLVHISRWVVPVVVICAFLCSVVPARGQGAAASGTATAQPDRFLAPFIDEETIAVVHLDVGKIDTAVIEKYVAGMMDEAKVPADDAQRKALIAGRAAADVFLARFKQLGGRHVYLVFSHPDIWPSMQPLAMLVKIEPGGDAKMLRQLITSTFKIVDPAPEEIASSKVTADEIAWGERHGVLKAAMLREDVLFIGQPVPLKRLKGIEPVARPELALEGAAPLEAAAALTADERRAIRELMPVLPAELGGGSTDFLTRAGVRFRVELLLPPTPSITLRFRDSVPGFITGRTGITPGAVLNAIDINSNFESLIAHLRDMLLASKEFKSTLNAQDLKSLAPQIEAVVKEVLTPRNGALSIEGAQIGALVKLAVPLSYVARERELRNTTAAYVRAIAQAACVYAADNKEMFPASMDVMVELGQIHEKQMYSPRDPKHRKFVYKPIIPESTTDAALPLVWEDVDPDAEGLIVAFADGHSEWMTRKAFDEAMKGAEAIKARYEADLKARGKTPPRP